MGFNAHNFPTDLGDRIYRQLDRSETDRIYVERKEDFSITNSGFIHCW
jgi:hypothetical protein